MRFSARLRAATAASTVAAAASLLAVVAPAASGATAAPAGSTGPATAGRTAAAAGGGHAGAVTVRQQRAVLRYWTRARMEHAVPVGPGDGAAAPLALPSLPALPGVTGLTGLLGGLVPPLELLAAPARHAAGSAHRPRSGGTAAQWQGGGAVARATGKIFFTLGGTDYVCSGAAVDGSADVAVTAAHCVSDGAGNWATNWTFVPGYSNGDTPYGSYTARQFFAASQWTNSADEDYDVAFVALNPASDGDQAVAATGGLPVAFGSQPAREYAFGYPSDSPYNGQYLYYCSGPTSPDPYHQTNDTGLPCGMTEGASGGPWLSGFDPATGEGTVTSVSTFKYDDSSGDMYGPDFGSTARSLYEQAEGAR
jgi:hypothetical protein